MMGFMENLMESLIRIFRKASKITGCQNNGQISIIFVSPSSRYKCTFTDTFYKSNKMHEGPKSLTKDRQDLCGRDEKDLLEDTENQNT